MKVYVYVNILQLTEGNVQTSEQNIYKTYINKMFYFSSDIARHKWSFSFPFFAFEFTITSVLQNPFESGANELIMWIVPGNSSANTFELNKKNKNKIKFNLSSKMKNSLIEASK